METISPQQVHIRSTEEPEHQSSNTENPHPQVQDPQQTNEATTDHKEKAKRINVNKFKTAYCRHFMRLGHCRLGDSCNFAHSKQELNLHRCASKKGMNKNCKTFFATMVCMEGGACEGRHEKRHLDVIHRYYYVCQLIKSESLNGFEATDWPVTESRLPVFEHIHQLDGTEESESYKMKEFKGSKRRKSFDTDSTDDSGQ